MKINLIASIIIFTVIISLNVYGFAVTSYYIPEVPLILSPGETTIVRAFGLQNMVGEEDITLKVEQTSGFEVAELVDDPEYDIPLGTKDVFVNFRVTIPEDAQVGQEYNIGASFSGVNNGGEDGSVQFSQTISYNFFVVVGKRIETEQQIPIESAEIVHEEELPKGIIIESKKGTGLGAIVLIVIVIFLIIFYLYEHSKKQKLKKKRWNGI